MVFKKRAQSAIEFLILIGAVLFFVTLFLMVVQGNVEQKNREKEEIIVQNMAMSIQDELNLAAKSTNGYSREFLIENTIYGKDYNVTLSDNRVYIKTERIAMSYPVVGVYGNVKKGINIIKKQNNSIYLN